MNNIGTVNNANITNVQITCRLHGGGSITTANPNVNQNQNPLPPPPVEYATAPGDIELTPACSGKSCEKGENPVGGTTNVVIPDPGDIDRTGVVTGWVGSDKSEADMIKFIVTDAGNATSIITIDGSPYTSGDDYTITSTNPLTIVVTTSESGKTDAVRTFVVSVLPPIVDAEIDGVTIPVAGGTPVTSLSDNGQYSTTISWNPNNNPFLINTIYTATITITPDANYTLIGVPVNYFTVAGATSVNNAANSGTITAVFPNTPYGLRSTAPDGGYVFYVDSTSGKTYEAGFSDTQNNPAWSPNRTTYIGTNTAIGTGQANSAAIIAQAIELGNNSDGVAAQACADYNGGDETDWFLPSKDELNKMYVNLVSGTDQNNAIYTPVGNFSVYDYWSSSESSSTQAWVEAFGYGAPGYQYFLSKNVGGNHVRCVRSF